MRRIKGRTARKLFEAFPRLKQRYYRRVRRWGGHLWARGYFCVSAGALSKEVIEEYLAHHFRREGPDGFEIQGKSSA
jgi:putative transposase